MREAELGEFIVTKTGSVNPINFPNEQFEYFSIPAYDKGEPELTLGSSIGSSKKYFQPGDVLLSRIVPHIRRCWIVPKSHDHRQIGSGEWIVFRTSDVYSSFLRFYLMSDVFNLKFMKTIKGVGGSLMRADPNQVKRFKLLLPPLEEQKKITAILDAADEYRQKTKALIDKYDQLTQSLFLDMFGDPVTNPIGLPVKKGDELFKFTSGKYKPTKNLSQQYEFPSYGGNGITGMSQSFLIDFPTIVIGRVGAYCGSIHCTKGKTWITDNAIYIKEFYEDVNLTYAYFFFKGYNLNRFADYSGQPKITQKPMQNMPFIYPDLPLQNLFAERVAQIEKQKQQAEASLVKAEELFSSLLQRAFKGELTS